MRRTLLALALLAVVLPARPADAAETSRIGGATRYDTAAAVALEAFPRAATVVVASGERFPDALAAPNLVHDEDGYRGPVLLTARDTLPAATRDALRELQPGSVVLLGGWPAISAEVEREIERTVGFDVHRIHGLDRYETAAGSFGVTYNAEADVRGTVGGMVTAILVSGEAFPDALAAGPVAYDLKLAVALARRDSLPDPTRRVLTEPTYGIEQVLVVGGTAAISGAVDAELRSLGVAVRRVAGATRQDTAIALAELHADEVGREPTEVLLAKAQDFPDALASTPLGGERGSPLLLAGAATDAWLRAHPSVERITALGDVTAPRWSPSRADTWHLQLQGDLVTDVDVDVYDVDLFDTSEPQIDALHGDGRRVVCYVSAGSWEEWRTDAGSWPDAALGEPLEDWEGERWVDVRSTAIRPVLAARLDLAATKGCDGVDPDNVDGYQHATGFPLTEADSLAFVRWLVEEGHERGLAVGLKNALELVPQLADEVDFAVNEQCVAFDECDLLGPYAAAGVAVFGVEYEGSFSAVCAGADGVGSWLLADLALDGRARPCETG